MIYLNDFSFGFKEQLLFKSIDLKIRSDEITVLTGGNGSGKTTFCRLIMALTNGYSGSLKINEEEQRTYSTKSLSNIITYIKQEPSANIVSDLPIEDLKIWQDKFMRKDIDDEPIVNALNFFGLDDQLSQPVWELSSGQQKRVGLAALLLNRDKFWLLDEPTSGLDNQLIKILLNLIEDQRAQKRGMLIISHRNEKFTAVADRILEIQDKSIKEIV